MTEDIPVASLSLSHEFNHVKFLLVDFSLRSYGNYDLSIIRYSRNRHVDPRRFCRRVDRGVLDFTEGF